MSMSAKSEFKSAATAAIWGAYMIRKNRAGRACAVALSLITLPVLVATYTRLDNTTTLKQSGYAKTMNALTTQDHASADTGMICDHTVPLLRTPAAFKAHRQTFNGYVLDYGKEIVLFDAEGPGCLRHFWISTDCAGPGLRIRIHVDDAELPQIDMELNHFFGILLDKKPYSVESPGIKVLPLGSRNCYLPIPFARS